MRKFSSDDIVLKPHLGYWFLKCLFPIMLIVAIFVGVSFLRNYKYAAQIGGILELLILFFIAYKYIDMLLCTKWVITEEQIYILKGVFTRTVSYIELYRVFDYEEKTPFIQRLLGNTNYYIYSGDKSSPILPLIGIKDGQDIIELIRGKVERQKKVKSIYEITNR